MLPIANTYGNVDIRQSLPPQYTHVPGKRLQIYCRKLGIEYAQAVTGFTKSRKQWKPKYNGVVVLAKEKEKLLAEINKPRKKRTPEQLAIARKRKSEKDQSEFIEEIKRLYPFCPCPELIAEHACQVGSGRVGRTSTIDLQEKVRLAVLAHIRHEETDYDHLFDGSTEKEEVRAQVNGQVKEIEQQWKTG